MHTCTVCMHACMYTYIHAFTYTHTHMHIHTHIHYTHALHYNTLHYITIHCITSHHTTSHYITLRTLHYIYACIGHGYDDDSGGGRNDDNNFYARALIYKYKLMCFVFSFLLICHHASSYVLMYVNASPCFSSRVM